MKLFKYPFVTKCFPNFTELGGQLLRLPEVSRPELPSLTQPFLVLGRLAAWRPRLLGRTNIC